MKSRLGALVAVVVLLTTSAFASDIPVSNPGGPYFALPSTTIQLDGSASFDPGGLTLTYAWDLTGNGLFTDSNAAKPSFSAGNVAGVVYTICLKVSNGSFSNTNCTDVDVESTLPTSAPEPASLVLLGSGVIGIAGVLRRKLSK